MTAALLRSSPDPAELAEPADDHQVVPRGEALPLGNGRPVGRLGQRPGLGRAGKDVAGLDEFRQHHDARALGCGDADRVARRGAVARGIADAQAELAGGHPDGMAVAARCHPASLAITGRIPASGACRSVRCAAMAALFNRIIPILFVSDLEAERDFYVRLGFHVTYEGPEYPHFLALGHGPVEFGIERKAGFRSDIPDQVLTWQFGVRDIAAARNRLGPGRGAVQRGADDPQRGLDCTASCTPAPRTGTTCCSRRAATDQNRTWVTIRRSLR